MGKGAVRVITALTSLKQNLLTATLFSGYEIHSDQQRAEISVRRSAQEIPLSHNSPLLVSLESKFWSSSQCESKGQAEQFWQSEGEIRREGVRGGERQRTRPATLSYRKAAINNSHHLSPHASLDHSTNSSGKLK